MSDDRSVTEASFAEEGIPPSTGVVRAVAEGEGVDPVDLPPLYDAVDSAALDALSQGATPVRLEFTYNGYEIAVLDDERVVARKAE